MTDANRLIPTMTHLPKQTREKLQERAGAEGRSVSQMLARIAEQALVPAERGREKAT